MSTRNQLPGTVSAIEHGGVMSTVKVTLSGGDNITAAITREASEDLGLAPGVERALRDDEPLDRRVLPALLSRGGWTSLRIDDDSDRYLAVAQRSAAPGPT